jgi:flagellar basal body-associated protein FliL
MARRSAMKAVQHTSAWRTFSIALSVLLVVAAVGAWAVSSVFASKPSTAGVAAPVEAAAAISPMEFMITRGRHLPVTDYAEPF